jgi:hypothetical protein
MPGYPGSGQAALIRENRQVFLFQNETIPAGTVNSASIAVQLERIRSLAYPWGVSFEIYFTDSTGVTPANPGNFEVDVQTADVDENTHYCTISALTSVSSLNSYFVGRIELPQFWAKYVRVYLKTLTNAVNITALVTR